MIVEVEPLSPAGIEYERDGYVVFRGLLDADSIAAAATDADRVLERYKHLIAVQNLRCRWSDNVYTGECQFDAFDPIIDLSPACRRLASDPRLLAALRGLYGQPACLFKDKLIFKMPGAKGYKLHQDWIAWDRFPRSFNSVLVPLDPADRNNGCTIVYPGYHHNGPLSPADGDYHELPPETVDEAKAVPLELAPGDVAVFGGFTPHRSDPNTTDRPRRQLYFSYTRLSDGGDLRGVHYQDFRKWLKVKYSQYGKTGLYFE